MHPIHRLALPALLALAITAPAAAQAPPIDLRDYWLVADIHNTVTGERHAWRIDCSTQSPDRCREGLGWMRGAVSARHNAVLVDAKTGQEELLLYISVEWLPSNPHLLGLVAIGARGWLGRLSTGGRLVTYPVGMLLKDVRSPEGLRNGMATRRNKKTVAPADSGIDFRLWLMTPAELEAAAAAAADTATQRALLLAERARLTDRLAEIAAELDRLAPGDQ